MFEFELLWHLVFLLSVGGCVFGAKKKRKQKREEMRRSIDDFFSHRIALTIIDAMHRIEMMNLVYIVIL